MAESALAAALSKLQGNLPSVRKSRTAEIESKRTGKTHRYKYADLSDVAAAIMPRLPAHGLAFIGKPTITEHGFVLAYSLLHTSGEREDGQYPLPSSGTPQEIGSAITYARRYCLCAVTGMATEDDDGHAASQAPAARQRRPARTAHDDRQHADLVRAVGERGRPAERTKGPIPDQDNLWQEPAPEGNGKEPGRVGLIVQHFKRLGIEDRGVRLGYTAALTGHAVNSTSELTEAEQKQLLDVLSKCRNQAALDQQSKQEAST